LMFTQPKAVLFVGPKRWPKWLLFLRPCLSHALSTCHLS